jgi:hypothetical protein
MFRMVKILVPGFVLALIAGCGGGKPEPAKSTPPLTPQAQESMRKAQTDGGGPEMVKKKLAEQGIKTE